ncbi:hypothetical protein HMN09_00746100 [Mycena chlorophos]|uniref:Uncharacterized protein n=1 Tax=Mycena chlorophos TaxID=658473 RepID=A0A8H6WB21_MYCCL|nr:hypothetical protein HMN09_00746100 [Mycena chlorophos]
MQPTHSFNSRHGEARSHRRCTSEPLSSLVSGPPRPRPSFSPVVSNVPRSSATPVLLRPKRYSILRKPRPSSELFGPNQSTETHLGSPRIPTQSHPKTRIAQPVLKLAAVKERLEDLESTNERLTVQIDSLKTDIEMLNSSVSYFSSEYYSGLLTIRDLRARSKKDAEILSAQEQQLCQLKKFVGLMVELGLHEPVLARAHGDVLKGKEDFEARLVDAIRGAAARPGSAWSQILSEVDPSRPVVPIVAVDEARSTVDDLLKTLKNGDIPSMRHRSVSQRFNRPVSKSPARHLSTPTKGHLRSPRTPKLATNSPARPRSPLKMLDTNRKTTSLCTQKANAKKRSVEAKPLTLAPPELPESKSLSKEGAVASLQRILDHFSSGSLGSLEMTADDTESVLDSEHVPSGFIKSPIRIHVRPPTSFKHKGAATTKKLHDLPENASPQQMPSALGSPYSSPVGRRSRSSAMATSASPSLGRQMRKAGKSGWR